MAYETRRRVLERAASAVTDALDAAVDVLASGRLGRVEHEAIGDHSLLRAVRAEYQPILRATWTKVAAATNRLLERAVNPVLDASFVRHGAHARGAAAEFYDVLHNNDLAALYAYAARLSMAAEQTVLLRREKDATAANEARLMEHIRESIVPALERHGFGGARIVVHERVLAPPVIPPALAAPDLMALIGGGDDWMM